MFELSKKMGVSREAEGNAGYNRLSWYCLCYFARIEQKPVGLTFNPGIQTLYKINM